MGVLKGVQQKQLVIYLATGFGVAGLVLFLTQQYKGKKKQQKTKNGRLNSQFKLPYFSVSLVLRNLWYKQRSQDDIEIPDQFRDPISLELMEDPVVLSGTGQIYDYHSIKSWLMSDNRKCPNTNIDLYDVEIIRIPLLKQMVQDWMKQNNVQSNQKKPKQLDWGLSDLEMHEIDENLPSILKMLSSGRSSDRGLAAANINDIFYRWHRSAPDQQPQKTTKQNFKNMIIDSLAWLLRYGESYDQGVAAYSLSYCSEKENLKWVKATCFIPLMRILSSTNAYARQGASRALSHLLADTSSREKAINFGVVPLLLNICKEQKVEGRFGCFSASILSQLMYDNSARAQFNSYGGKTIMTDILKDDKSHQYDKQSAAQCLLELHQMGSLDQSYGDDVDGLSIDQIARLAFCSSDYLLKKTSDPLQNFSKDDLLEYLQAQNSQAFFYGWIRQGLIQLPEDDQVKSIYRQLLRQAQQFSQYQGIN